MRLPRLLRPRTTVHAHCDLPCGVYDPGMARLEIDSVKACMEKYAASDDPQFRERAIMIKEQRADLAKQHLWVLWTDYFKPEHAQRFPQLHQLFWDATKAAGNTKKSLDPADAQKTLDLIDQIDEIFRATKAAPA